MSKDIFREKIVAEMLKNISTYKEITTSDEVTIERLVTFYDNIMSADGEAIKVLKNLGTMELNQCYSDNEGWKYIKDCWLYRQLEKTLLQSPAKEQELAKLKEKAAKIRRREVCYHNNSRHYYDRKYHKGKAEVIDELFGRKEKENE